MVLRMSAKELDRLALMGELESGRLSRGEAAAVLGVSERQLRRIVRRFEAEGAEGLLHRSRGRPSNRGIDAAVRARAAALMADPDLHDYGPTLMAETLEAEAGIAVSRETVRQWMMAEERWTPRRAKVRHRQWRERKACLGEMVQMDTSIHDWFEGRGEAAVLIAMVDDATSRLYCRFFPTDSTATNMTLLRDYIGRYGRPRSLYVDKASHFMTTRPATADEQRAGKHAQTQIQRALAELDIAHISAHSPQAKGRVERSFRTLQDRLVKGLRRARIATIEAANAYLEHVFVPLWDQRFTQAPREAADLHRPRRGFALDAIFSHQETRQVADDYTVAYRGQRYQIEKRSIRAGLRRSPVIIEQRLDGNRKLRWRGRYLRWHPLPTPPAPAPRRTTKRAKASGAPPHRPAADHPWRQGCSLMKASETK
jgi:hypothetical protein